jgi:DNA-binding transcriptional MerR regulator
MKTTSEHDPAPDPLYDLDPDTTFTVEWVAQQTGVSSQTIVYYREQGLIRAAASTDTQDQARFDVEALRTLRRLEHLRASCQLTESGILLVGQLLREIEQLRTELRCRT